MDDRFDKKLSSRITEVFDNYEHPTADEGWTALRKKFPVKEERKIAWLWWAGAAAILLVFLGIGLWLINTPDSIDNVAVLSKKQPGEGHSNARIKRVNGNKSATAAIKLGKSGNALRPEIKSASPAGFPDFYRTARGTYDGAVTRMGSKANVDYGLNADRAGNPDQLTLPVDVPSSISKIDNGTDAANNNTSKILGNVAVLKPDPAPNTADEIADERPLKTTAAAAANNTMATVKPVKTIDDLFKQDKPQSKKQEADKKELKKVNFSVYAATYFNYAQGSTNQVNAGAGFTSDITLSKNIKLSTGISIAQNTLSYASTPPLAAGRAFAEAVPAIRSTGFFNTTTTVAEFRNYNASLVGLDIPLNIKFEFNPQKTDAYISAGVSSGTFIDERYTYIYAYQTNGLTDKAATTQNQTTATSFNNFYFAKTLNVSFGVGYPVGKNRLVIEPFLKYPLAGLGTQDIHFGAGGINLKFSFKATKR